MVRPLDSAHGALYHESVHWKFHHWREALIRQLSAAGKDVLGRGVEADSDREQGVKILHCYVLVKPNESQPLKAQDRVNPGG